MLFGKQDYVGCDDGKNICLRATLRWWRLNVWRIKQIKPNVIWWKFRMSRNFITLAESPLYNWIFDKSLILEITEGASFEAASRIHAVSPEQAAILAIILCIICMQNLFEITKHSHAFSLGADNFNNDGYSPLHCRLWYSPIFRIEGPVSIASGFHSIVAL